MQAYSYMILQAATLTWMQVNFAFCFAFNYISRQNKQLFCSIELNF